jgi:hypothetical protein
MFGTPCSGVNAGTPARLATSANVHPNPVDLKSISTSIVTALTTLAWSSPMIPQGRGPLPFGLATNGWHLVRRALN